MNLQPLGDRLIVDGAVFPASLKATSYEADLQLNQASSLNDTIALSLLFPRPAGRQAKLKLFGGR